VLASLTSAHPERMPKANKTVASKIKYLFTKSPPCSILPQKSFFKRNQSLKIERKSRISKKEQSLSFTPSVASLCSIDLPSLESSVFKFSDIKQISSLAVGCHCHREILEQITSDCLV